MAPRARAHLRARASRIGGSYSHPEGNPSSNPNLERSKLRFVLPNQGPQRAQAARVGGEPAPLNKHDHRLFHRGAAHGTRRHARSADRAHAQVTARQEHDGPRAARRTLRGVQLVGQGLGAGGAGREGSPHATRRGRRWTTASSCACDRRAGGGRAPWSQRDAQRNRKFADGGLPADENQATGLPKPTARLRDSLPLHKDPSAEVKKC